VKDVLLGLKHVLALRLNTSQRSVFYFELLQCCAMVASKDAPRWLNGRWNVAVFFLQTAWSQAERF